MALIGVLIVLMALSYLWDMKKQSDREQQLNQQQEVLQEEDPAAPEKE